MLRGQGAYFTWCEDIQDITPVTIVDGNLKSIRNNTRVDNIMNLPLLPKEQ